MASARQIESNRQNATLSTGPRTAAGKARASRNATKLGLFSRELLLPGEDADRLDQLRRTLTTSLHPVDAVEAMLVEQIVAANWKLQRLAQAEQAFFAMETDGSGLTPAHRKRLDLPESQLVKVPREGYTVIHPDLPAHVALARRIDRDQTEAFSRHEQRLTNAIHRALKQLRDYRKAKAAVPDEPIWQDGVEGAEVALLAPSPLYSGERVGVRGPRTESVSPLEASCESRPFTPALSSEYKGEGAGESALHPKPHSKFKIEPLTSDNFDDSVKPDKPSADNPDRAPQASRADTGSAPGIPEIL